MGLDYSEFNEFLASTRAIEAKYSKFLTQFLSKEGQRTVAYTKKLTPVDRGDLRDSWEKTPVYYAGGNLSIDVFNPLHYASHIEFGQVQKRRRFVPGYWTEHGKFRYNRNAKGGMVVSPQYVPGYYMATLSLNRTERDLPHRLDREQRKFMEKWRW